MLLKGSQREYFSPWRVDYFVMVLQYWGFVPEAGTNSNQPGNIPWCALGSGTEWATTLWCPAKELLASVENFQEADKGP